MASFIPERPSAHITRTSFTPRFFSSFRTPSQYFALSFSPICMDKTSLWPVKLTARITYAASFLICPLSRTEKCTASMKTIGYTSSIKRTILPIFYLRKKPVCDVRYHSVADFKAVDLLDGIAYLTSCHTLCVQRDYLLLNAGDVLLTLFYHLWLKCSVSILRYFDLSFA